MSTPLDELLATTFADRASAETVLNGAGGNLPRARKALAQKKSTPMSPALGPRVRALVEAARSHGSPASKSAGPLSFIGYGVPPDVAALLWVSMHWEVERVELGGALLHGAGITTSDPLLRGGSVMPLHLGHLASGEQLVWRYHQGSPSTWVAVAPDGAERTFADLEAVLDEIVADAERRGVAALRPAPKKGARPPGPPVATPGEDHRVYAGAAPIEVELPSVDLFRPPRVVVVRLVRKTKLPEDDLWLVSRDGALFRLRMSGPVKRGSVACFAEPVEA